MKKPLSNYPTPLESDFIIPNFQFSSGETLPELKLHYTTLGAPQRDGTGLIRNAILILHGTGGSGQGFLREQFAGVLFGPGQLLDANDMIYQFDASRDYNPWPDLEKIKAPLLAINSADDQVNPPELGLLEPAIERLKRGRYILLPISDRTRGHGTHSLPEIWQHHLAELLAETS